MVYACKQTKRGRKNRRRGLAKRVEIPALAKFEQGYGIDGQNQRLYPSESPCQHAKI
jgi:hypothetical protein